MPVVPLPLKHRRQSERPLAQYVSMTWAQRLNPLQKASHTYYPWARPTPSFVRDEI